MRLPKTNFYDSHTRTPHVRRTSTPFQTSDINLSDIKRHDLGFPHPNETFRFCEKKFDCSSSIYLITIVW